jgi:hypothetical protein
MAGYWEEWTKNYVRRVQERAQEVAIEVTNELGKEADEYAFKIMLPVARHGVTEAYKDAAEAWYGAYSPSHYGRGYSLYNAMQMNDYGGKGVGWQFSESMAKPSWGGGSFNIYGGVFMGGAHGGPVHGRSPASSTPIPALFEASVDELVSYLQDEIYKIGQGYFEEHFSERFNRRFTL